MLKFDYILVKSAIFLFSIFVVSSVFQASAIINFSSFSISTPYFSASLFFLYFLFLIFCKGFFLKRKVFLVCAFFWFFCLFSLIYPFLFSGESVLVSRIGIDVGVLHPGKLLFSVSNIAQFMYLTLNLSLLLFCISSIALKQREFILKVFIFSGWIICFFSYYQLISKYFNIPYPNSILYSNSHYAQGYMQNLGSMKRVNATFTEPSLAAGCLISFFSYYAIKAVSNFRFIFPSLVFLMAAIITISSTAIAGFIFLLCFIFFLEKSKVLLLVSIIAFIFSLFFFHSYFDATLFHKFSSLSGEHRGLSNLFSLKLLINTYGLGVGLGSSRPSSFIFYLLSNVGVIGTLVFAYLVYIPWSAYYKVYRSLSTKEKSIFCIFSIYLLCKFTALPDLNDTFFWVLLCLLYLFNPMYHNESYISE